MRVVNRPGSDQWYLLYSNGLLINCTGNVQSVDGYNDSREFRFGVITTDFWNDLVTVNRAVRKLLGVNEDAIPYAKT